MQSAEGFNPLLLIVIFVSVLLPVLHAVRSRDFLTIFGAIVLSVAAVGVALAAKSVIHEILAALLWIAAYLAAAFADHLRAKKD